MTWDSCSNVAYVFDRSEYSCSNVADVFDRSDCPLLVPGLAWAESSPRLLQVSAPRIFQVELQAYNYKPINSLTKSAHNFYSTQQLMSCKIFLHLKGNNYSANEEEEDEDEEGEEEGARWHLSPILITTATTIATITTTSTKTVVVATITTTTPITTTTIMTTTNVLMTRYRGGIHGSPLRLRQSPINFTQSPPHPSGHQVIKNDIKTNQTQSPHHPSRHQVRARYILCRECVQ